VGCEANRPIPTHGTARRNVQRRTAIFARAARLFPSYSQRGTPLPTGFPRHFHRLRTGYSQRGPSRWNAHAFSPPEPPGSSRPPPRATRAPTRPADRRN
jgi:hypothetical protein